MKTILVDDGKFLERAIELSRQSVKTGNFPVGAILAKDGEKISSGISNGKQLRDATGHAEINAIRKASEILDSRDLKETTLYSSLEPCIMCLQASYWASIPKIVYACSKSKVSKQHYEGSHNINKINEANFRPIELVHLKSMEADALKVINDWEASLKT